MRSAKSELYLFIKNALLGGTYIDYLNNTYTYAALTSIRHYGFWNNELTNPDKKDTYPVPAVFFEVANTNLLRQESKTNISEKNATTKDNAEFILHLIMGKFSSEVRENDYLDQIDLADTITNRITGRNCANIHNIRRISERQDPNSEVLMDWQMTFNATITNIGLTVQVDANDEEVNPEAPVLQEFNLLIKKNFIS